jgi:uncharacterized protein Veg
MDMKENARKLVYNMLSGKTKQIKDSLRVALGSKINVKLDQRRKEISKDILKK